MLLFFLMLLYHVLQLNGMVLHVLVKSIKKKEAGVQDAVSSFHQLCIVWIFT